MKEGVGVVAVMGLMVAVIWMRQSIIFSLFRKMFDALPGGHSYWRTPAQGTNGKSVRWIVAAFCSYLAIGLGLAWLFPDPNRAWVAAYIILPLVVAAWAILIRSKT